jgi:4-cresol dehydrogenase (hydroxylating)
MPDLRQALLEWRAVLGDARVSDDANVLAREGRSTLPGAHAPAAVLLPRDRDDVVALVRVAHAHGVPLYPISRGRNWGYGDRCPVGPGQVLVDLGGLNRIVEVNEELAYVIVEPGVTQGQLLAHLRETGSGLWLDATGSGLESSVLGNSIERGFGHTPYGDHFANTAGFEVVLADGTLFSTGFGDYADPRLAATYKWGLGPVVDGLFSQSGLGVVTRGTVWLMPAPEASLAYVVRVERPERLPEVIDRLRPLRLDGTIPQALHLANDLRVLSSKLRHPGDERGGRTALTAEQRAQLCKRYRIEPWMAMGGLYGSPARVRLAFEAVEGALQGVAKVDEVDEGLLRLAERVVPRLPRRLRESTEGVVDVARRQLELLRGIPSDYFLKSSGWCVGGHAPTAPEPLDADAGFYWVAPLCPMTGRDVAALLGRMEPILARHGVDPMFTLSLLNGRAVVCVTTLYFDRADPARRAAARACHDELLDALLAHGNVPYRLGVDSMARLPADAPYWQLIDRLKAALDPKGILAPGRYHPTAAKALERSSL